jgi:putative ABC transport system substrate-binding protein
VIEWLESGSRQTTADYSPTFRRGLAEAGYVEGQNVVIVYRWAEAEAAC